MFEEFPPISTEEWELRIKEDLKDLGAERSILDEKAQLSELPIHLKSYYRAEDLYNLEYHKYQDLQTERLQKENKNHKNQAGNDWQIRQDIEEENIATANKIALEAIKKGADAIGFNATKAISQSQLSSLLKGIDLNKTAIHFTSSKCYTTLFDLLGSELTERGEDFSKVQFTFNFDPLSYLMLHGNFYSSKENNFYEGEYIINKLNNKTKTLSSPSHFKIITINGHYFHNAGGTVTEELGFSLASANEYLYQLTSKGNDISIEDAAKSIMFSFASGSNYFIEIAKLRAARLLWERLLEVYKLKNGRLFRLQNKEKKYDYKPIPMYIHTYTSLYNKTIYDTYNNMLRTTTEAMSAAIGGADSITVHPFDKFDYSAYKINKARGKQGGNENFAFRIARNTQLILKSESYLNQVADPSAGSYYIENLTDSVAKASWELFKEVEAKGGFIESIKQNFIQNKIEETSEKRKERIANRSQIILGINQYPNGNENSDNKAQILNYKEKEKETEEAIYKKLNIHRASKEIELIRQATDSYIKKGNQKPKVFLLTTGNPGMRRARAAFASNFFGCAGYTIIDNTGFCTIDEGVKAAQKAKPQIVVICSSDEEYETIAPEIAKKIKEKDKEMLVVVAGNPKKIMAKLMESGVDDFISITSNLATTLITYQNKLGIK